MFIFVSVLSQEAIAEVIWGFEKTVMSVNSLTADPDFDSLTQRGEFEVAKNCKIMLIFL